MAPESSCVAAIERLGGLIDTGGAATHELSGAFLPTGYPEVRNSPRLTAKTVWC
jgi:hypothetical protein